MSKHQDSQIDIRFRFRALSKTPDGVLIRFLKRQKDTGFSQEMILKSARAFWLAQAYQDWGGKPSNEIQKLAQNMILVLEDQIAYLRAMFNIERPQQIPIPLYAVPPAQVLPQEETPVEEEDCWDSVSVLDTGGL